MTDGAHDPALEQALEEQQTLVETSLPAVFEAYDAALKDGLRRPVVLLIDCEDEIGGPIARAWLGDDTVDDAVAASSGEGGETTVFATAFGWKDCAREIPVAFPYLAPVFEGAPPDDGVLVVSVTSGGASALTAPFDARPEE